MVQSESTGRFAAMFNKKMDELHFGLRDTAAKLQCSYEYVRRLSRGETLPSKWFVIQLVDKLDLDRQQVEQAVTQDKIEYKFGPTAEVLAGRDPELTPFTKVLSQLDADRRKVALTFLRGLLAEQEAEQPRRRANRTTSTSSVTKARNRP